MDKLKEFYALLREGQEAILNTFIENGGKIFVCYTNSEGEKPKQKFFEADLNKKDNETFSLTSNTFTDITFKIEDIFLISIFERFLIIKINNKDSTNAESYIRIQARE